MKTFLRDVGLLSVTCEPTTSGTFTVLLTSAFTFLFDPFKKIAPKISLKKYFSVWLI